MKNKIEMTIKQFVKQYPEVKNVETKWLEPLIAFADAKDERFQGLKDSVSPTHGLPTDILPEAKTVVAYFLPFHEDIVKSNEEGRECSKAWAKAYVETNKLILDLNTFITGELEKLGHKTSIIPATHNFDTERLISDWSHRHVAVIAGLGKFGLNNMLITDKGCCGRIGTFIIDIEIEPTEGNNEENCLYKHMNICKKCVDNCVNDALTAEGFDRHKCYEMCLHNDMIHSDIPGVSDACGKCLVNLPCSTTNPVKLIK
jgi:epoxyqueuosine reductase QueG